MKTLTILAIAALAMPAMGYVYQKTSDIHDASAMEHHISDLLRVYDSQAHDWRMKIAEKADRIWDLKQGLSKDPQIIRWQHELEIELKGYQKQLEQVEERIRYEEKQKRSLRRKLATA